MDRIRLLLSLLTLFALGGGVHAQSRTTLEEYVERYRAIAVGHAERYGIPASISLAQGILESDCGNGRLAREANNHFGIKCKREWKGATIRHDDDAPGECFRRYGRPEESWEDHALYLDAQPRYDSLFAYPATDYRSWARGLKACGYATDPLYAEKLVRIIEEYDLARFDRPAGPITDDAARSSLDAPTAPSLGDEEAVDVDRYRIAIPTHGGYSVWRANDVEYVEAREGDDYAGIARRFSTRARRLARFNDDDPSRRLARGERVYLRSKRPRWQGSELYHEARSGESLREVAQHYGMRLRALERRSGIDRSMRLAEGQHVRLR